MLKMPRTPQKTNLETIAVAALIGGLAGAVVGLMLAPKSGKALRQGIHEKADNFIGKAEDIRVHHTGALKQQGTDLVGKGRKLAEDLQAFIQESLKIRKSSQTNESLETKLEIEPEITPPVLVQTGTALEEE